MDDYGHSNNFLIKSTYFLNNKGLAATCVDSIFSFSQLTQVSTYEFKYDNDDYKTSSVKAWKIYKNGNFDYSGIDSVNFNIESGNTISDYGSSLDCSFFYDFNSLENKIDINTFLGTFNGRMNKNLIIAYHSNCHSSSGTTPASSNYEYILNDSNMVVQKIDNYISSQHKGDQINNEKRISDFHYFFK